MGTSTRKARDVGLFLKSPDRRSGMFFEPRPRGAAASILRRCICQPSRLVLHRDLLRRAHEITDAHVFHRGPLRLPCVRIRVFGIRLEYSICQPTRSPRPRIRISAFGVRLVQWIYHLPPGIFLLKRGKSFLTTIKTPPKCEKPNSPRSATEWPTNNPNPQLPRAALSVRRRPITSPPKKNRRCCVLATFLRASASNHRARRAR